MLPLACLVASSCIAAIDPPAYDCFGRTCTFEPPIGARVGRADGIVDSDQCVGDWNLDGSPTPSDVAGCAAAWFHAAAYDGVCDADLDCNGLTTPADLSLFVNYWFAAATTGCP